VEKCDGLGNNPVPCSNQDEVHVGFITDAETIHNGDILYIERSANLIRTGSDSSSVDDYLPVVPRNHISWLGVFSRGTCPPPKTPPPLSIVCFALGRLTFDEVWSVTFEKKSPRLKRNGGMSLRVQRGCLSTENGINPCVSLVREIRMSVLSRRRLGWCDAVGGRVGE